MVGQLPCEHHVTSQLLMLCFVHAVHACDVGPFSTLLDCFLREQRETQIPRGELNSEEGKGFLSAVIMKDSQTRKLAIRKNLTID